MNIFYFTSDIFLQYCKEARVTKMISSLHPWSYNFELSVLERSAWYCLKICRNKNLDEECCVEVCKKGGGRWDKVAKSLNVSCHISSNPAPQPGMKILLRLTHSLSQTHTNTRVLKIKSERESKDYLSSSMSLLLKHRKEQKPIFIPHSSQSQVTRNEPRDS